jgi:cell division septum initiation protein DivIVA
MKRDQIARDDFPADGTGYDRASVDAHLAAVAAWTAALEAQISALEVERDALRRSALQGAERAAGAQKETVDAGSEHPEPAVSEGTAAVAAEAGPVETSSEDEVSARLVATRLALEGSEREEIVSRLKGEYELDDPESLVEQVLGRL